MSIQHIHFTGVPTGISRYPHHCRPYLGQSCIAIGQVAAFIESHLGGSIYAVLGGRRFPGARRAPESAIGNEAIGATCSARAIGALGGCE